MADHPETVTPMFPLGLALVPTGLLPLRVFEPRYRALVRDVLDRDMRFGVTLIERGSEVGGGDSRFAVGTFAEIVQHEVLPDWRARMLTIGRERFVVRDWLPDDPYPRAEVVEHPDDPTGLDRFDSEDLVTHLRGVLALASEAGLRVPPATTGMPDDPDEAGWWCLALSPIQEIDRYRLLTMTDPRARVASLHEELSGLEVVIRARLASE